MAKRVRKRKCRHCHLFFLPDPRNAWHQHYCKKPECRKASKAESQRKWLEKEENKDHFRGPSNVVRVQEWRKAHPGYWRSKRPAGEDLAAATEAPPPVPARQEPLQDLLIEKTMEDPAVKASLGRAALQDLLIRQDAVLIGLIAHFTDTALQDDIVLAARRLQQLGLDILKKPNSIERRKTDDSKAHDCTRAYPKGPQPVQLGRPASGP